MDLNKILKLTNQEIQLILFLEKYTEGKWTINKKTGLVDIKGDFRCHRKELKDFKGVRFGVVTGDFDCSDNNLTSLEGAPQVVGGSFDCSWNNLTSLEGAPQEIGWSFYCHNNKLTSLEGAPQVVGENFRCYDNSLTSLEGAPQVVGNNFYCHDNKLTSLEGAPRKVGGYFHCHSNNLTSLVGAPQVVGGDFDCSYNPISQKTLKLVWETMQEKKVDYLGALCILKGQIDSGEWNKMIRGYEDSITSEAIKTYSIVSRYSL